MPHTIKLLGMKVCALQNVLYVLVDSILVLDVQFAVLTPTFTLMQARPAVLVVLLDYILVLDRYRFQECQKIKDHEF